jgi:RNA polymerase sigma-70 factor (ECF subfamily)
MMTSVQAGPSDADLVARVVVGDDRHAFATLVRRHQASVRSFVARLCAGDRGRADDAAQETFLLAYRRLSSWRGEGELRSWLLRIAYRAWATDRRRAHHRREHGAVDDDERAGQTGAGAADPAVDPTQRRDVSRALDTLREEERAALCLCFQEGLTHEEAAKVLGMPLGTLKSHVARGKEKLKHRLAAYQPPPSLPPREPSSVVPLDQAGQRGEQGTARERVTG